jgi:hypothetical protein
VPHSRLIIALLCLAGCSRPPPAEPAAAYRVFLHHVATSRGGEQVGLLDDFDAATRDALTREAAAASQAAGAQLPADPVIQLLQGLPPVPPTDIRVVEQSPDRAVLEVTLDAGGGGTVTMVHEGGRWRVHLEVPPLPAAPATAPR